MKQNVSFLPTNLNRRFAKDIPSESDNMQSLHNANRGRNLETEKAVEEYRKYFESGKKKTQNRNAIKLFNYCQWIKKSPEELLNEYVEARKEVNTLQDWKRDNRNKIVEFYNSMKAKGYAINYCRSEPLGIMRFYSDHAETIKSVTKEFDSAQMPTNDFNFTQDILRRMFFNGDMEEKAMLSKAISLGYSSIDFLSLETEQIKNIIKESRDKKTEIAQFIGKTREKTSIQPFSHLTPESISCLESYIKNIESAKGFTPKYLWCNGSKDTHITNQGLNKIIKRILKKSNVETYGKQVKFHGLRKFLYTILQAKNRDIGKVICGKKVSLSDLTYINNLDAECFKVFTECYKQISLTVDMENEQKKQTAIEELRNAVLNLQKEIVNQRTINDTLTVKYSNLEQKVLTMIEKNMITIESAISKIGTLTPQDAIKTLKSLQPQQD